MAKSPEIFGKIGEGFEDAVSTIVPRNLKKINKQAFAKELFNSFEAARNEHEGVEYWFARDLQLILGYAKWDKFLDVIDRAKQVCSNSGYRTEHHFLQAGKMRETDNGVRKEIKDMVLTRYACYLTAQCGDPRKMETAFAHTYFAEQTRRFELIVQQMEQYERLDAREKLKVTEQRLNGIVNQRGFTDKDFGFMRSEGDKALFGGITTREMKEQLGIPDNRPLADFTDTVIIKGKDFAAAMTAFNVEQNNLYGVERITNEHVVNNETVRRALLERSIIPEKLPAREDIRKVERKIRSQEKKLATIKTGKLEVAHLDAVQETAGEKEYVLRTINISKDLWKIALLIMATKPAGIITTAELIRDIPDYIVVPAKYKEGTESDEDPRYIQVIKNLKSNKRNRKNFIHQGYVTEIRGGYQITQKGLDFVRQEFRDYV